MNLGIITPNTLFRESLRSLLDNCSLTKDRCIILKDVTSQNIEELDVIISDYKLIKLEEILLNLKIPKNKIKDIEKIFITEKGLDLSPISSIHLTRPFRFFELVEALHLIIEQLKSKRENKKTFGYISFIIPDRKLIYKDNNFVELTEKESDIIVSLLNSMGRGITKEAVMSKVWKLNSKMETHTFETHLYRLRKKIKGALLLKNLIMNKGGRYYLNPEIIGQEN